MLNLSRVSDIAGDASHLSFSALATFCDSSIHVPLAAGRDDDRNPFIKQSLGDGLANSSGAA
jgi:hypothetical protein